MSARFDVDYTQIRQLEEKMKQLPDKMETEVNDTLHNFGVRTSVENITRLIRVSKKKKKRHAKTSIWSRSVSENLGFKVISRGGAANKKGSFGYLVFPNEGRGPRNPQEQRFAERGMNSSTPKILEKLHTNIDQLLREEL